MFELILVACLQIGVCEYLAVPMPYPSEARCAQQAAIIAGMVQGRHGAGSPLTYRYECRPAAVADADRPPPRGLGS